MGAEEQMKDVKVSVIMPVYNAADFLEESISDILTQSFKDFELICVDDGSTDDDRSIIEKYAKKDKRIKLISQPNKGGGAARNTGLDAAKGEYVLFLDADDRFESYLLEKTVCVAEKEKSEVLVFAADEFDFVTKKKRPAPWLLQSGFNGYDGNLFHYTTTTVWNKLFRRDYLKNNNIRFMDERVVADTMYFMFFALFHAANVSFFDEVLIHYRSGNPNSTTSKHDSRPKDMVTVLEKIWDRLRDDTDSPDEISTYVNFAIKYLFERAGWFSTYDGFSQMYETLHSDGFRRMGLTAENDSYIEDVTWKKLKTEIAEYSLPEYLFYREKSYKKKGLLTKTVYTLPDSLYDKLSSKECRVALYGAGMVGKSYFPQLQSIPTVRIVSWVDSGYDSIGFPLRSPEELKDLEFDYIVIGVEHKRFLSEIKERLSSLGVSGERVLWDVPGKQI